MKTFNYSKEEIEAWCAAIRTPKECSYLVLRGYHMTQYLIVNLGERGIDTRGLSNDELADLVYAVFVLEVLE